MMHTSDYDQQNDVTIETNDNKINRTRHPTTKPSKQLPEQAVRLMNAWYAAHEDDPYPNRNNLDYLATNVGIKESQVKAWFSNKRNRTQNTHPKRAKRYLVRNQMQQSPSAWNEPEKIHLADELEQRALLIQQQSYSNTQLPSILSTNWSWLPSNPYDYYQSY